jgi:uncharacterized glyoxalase superfamily protein PhnB
MLAVDGNVLLPLGTLPWSPLAVDIIDKFGIYWYLYLPN